MSSLKVIAIVVVAVVVLFALSALTPARDSRRAGPPPVAAACRNPQFIKRLTELPEASGLAASRTNPDVLWAHNDSAMPAIYAIGHDGAVRARVRVTGATVDDWEAISTGPCPAGSCVFIGDIGDNRAIRKTIVIYRAREPAVTDSATEPVQTLRAAYPDGPRDAEALFVTPEGTLLVITKGEGTPVDVYRFPSTSRERETVTLERVAILTRADAGKGTRVTDAALSPSGKWVALRTNNRLLFFQTAELVAGRPGPPQEFDLRQLQEPQGEGIAWTADNTLFLAGEGGGGGTLARISCTLPSA